jgi:carbonic anhydrase
VSATDDLLANNAAFAERFRDAAAPSRPAKRVAVIACMDARLDPARALGLAPGDAHVIRNAGGVVTDDEIRSLAISQHLLDTEEVIVIQHTDCGMLKVDEDEFAARLEQATGQRPHFAVHALADLETGVRDAIAAITDSAFIPRKQSVRGFVYEVETGRLREVAAR